MTVTVISLDIKQKKSTCVVSTTHETFFSFNLGGSQVIPGSEIQWDNYWHTSFGRMTAKSESMRSTEMSTESNHMVGTVAGVWQWWWKWSLPDFQCTRFWGWLFRKILFYTTGFYTTGACIHVCMHAFIHIYVLEYTYTVLILSMLVICACIHRI